MTATESFEFQNKQRLIPEFVHFSFSATEHLVDVKFSVISHFGIPRVFLAWRLNSLIQMVGEFWL